MKARQGIIGVVGAALGTVLLVAAFAVSAADAGLIQVEAGTHRLLRQTATVTRVAVGDPKIADVNVINGRELLITGKSLGVTSLMIWQAGKTTEYRVRVGGVTDPARASNPDPELAGATVERGAAVAGQLPNLLAHRRASIGAANGKDPVADSSFVAGDTQVMTEIRIAEMSRTTAQSYGFQFLKNSLNTTAGISGPGGLSSITRDSSNPGYTVGSSSGFVPLQNAFNLVFGNSNRDFFGVLSLLEGKGLARVLAEPSLVASSGQTASFLAGGEFPIPVSQGGGSGSAAAITIEYKEFGVRLNLTPTVLSRDRIALKVAPEVSELDYSAGIQIGGVSVPALNVRRTDTTVELGDGETFVISGLVSNNMQANVNKLPWLGSVPILGAFFKNTTNNRTEKELVMIVTPHLVRPMAREARLPALPGAQADQYKPGFTGLILEETGKFDTAEYGFSR